jgi:four helix bundle protein
MNLVENLPQGKSMSVISNQILRSATSFGANYRSARRAKSKRDFFNKLKIVVEEADETLYRPGLIQRSGKKKPVKLWDLVNEATEMLAIFVASIKTAKLDTVGKVRSTKYKVQTKVGSTKFEGRTTAG